jgi:transcriptional regulator GlxA family with amidase domain
MAGVCTGTMLLAHAGVVCDRRAGTHHTAWEDLAASGARQVKDRIVDDGDLITSGGVTGGIDLALWLIEREVSRPGRSDRNAHGVPPRPPDQQPARLVIPSRASVLSPARVINVRRGRPGMSVVITVRG